MGFNRGDKVRLTVNFFASEAVYAGAEGVVDGYHPTSNWPYTVRFDRKTLPHVAEDEIELIVEEPEKKKSKFNVGDRVSLTGAAPNDSMYNEPGVVIPSPYDSAYPVAVRFDNGTVFNCLFDNEVQLIPEARKDWTALTDEAQEMAVALDRIGLTEPSHIIRKVRDALIEESYRA